MKISYRTHPILERLHKGDLDILTLFQSDYDFIEIWDVYNESWNRHRERFAENVTYVTKPFSDAADRTYDKMSDLIYDMFKNGENYEFNGTYLFGPYVFMIDFKLIDNENSYPKTELFIFTKEGTPLLWSSEKSRRIKFWVSHEVANNMLKIRLTTNEDLEKFNHFSVFKCILFSMFQRFASVETKMLTAGLKTKDIDVKYVNDTKFNILHLDSKWYTNLVKSDGFNVRGHFRFQACGHGLKDRKLIWINDFTKAGYTAPARKLSHDFPKNN